MRGIVVGMGEVGTAHYNLLKKAYPDTSGYDVRGPFSELQPSKDEPYEILHVALNYAAFKHQDFVRVVAEYAVLCAPKVINVLSTVRPGTCEELGPRAVHSTTRGLHPNLESGLRAIPKHVGGPMADKVARYFRKAGITCVTHKLARTTELAHILNNAAYGVNLMFADEMSALCREYGVDYSQAVMLYTMTNNEGYRRLDHESKCRMVLTPPGGKIGGHCVAMSAGLVPEDKRGAIMHLLATYNDPQDAELEKAYQALVDFKLEPQKPTDEDVKP